MADDIKLVVGVDYTELTGLIRTTGETKTAVKALAQDFSKTGNQRQYMRGINRVVAAQRNLSDSSRMSQSEIMKLGAETRRQTRFKEALANATKSAARAEKNFTESQMAATKESKNFGVVTQQAGYQVSDFIVQIQSGTNGFVAFGQQASQLVGVLPLVASRIGLTTGAAIGLSASLGIIIPIITMVGAALTRTGGEAKTFSDAIGEVESALSDYEDALDNILDKDLEEKFGSTAESIRKIEEATLDLSLALGKIEISNAFAKLTEDVDKSLTATQKLLRGMSKTGGQLLDIITFGQGDYRAAAGELFTGDKALKEMGLGGIIQEQDITNLQALFKTGQFKAALYDIEDIFNDIKASNRTLGVDAITFLLNLKDSAKTAAELQAKLDGSAEKAKKRTEEEKQRLKNEEFFMKVQEDYIAESEEAAKKAAETRKKIRLKEFEHQSDLIAKQKNEEIDTAVKIYNERKATRKKLDLEAYEYQSDLIAKQKNEEIDTAVKIYNERKATRKKLDLEAYEYQSDLIAKQKENELEVAVEIYKKRKELEEELHNTRVRLQMEFNKTPIFINMNSLEKAAEIYKGRLKEEGKTKPESMASIIKSMEEEAKLQRQIVGLSEKEADRLQILYDLKEQNKTASGKMTEAQLKQAAERIAAINAETAAMEAQMQKIQDVADSIETHFGDALMGIVTDFDILNGSIEDFGYNAEQVFKKMASEIIKELYRIFVVKKITGFVEGAITGTYADLGRVGAPSMDGGGYTGSGPRSGGLDGKGGFLAMLHPRETVIDHTKGQSGGVTIQQSFNFSANGDESVKRMIAQAAPQIAKMTEKGIMDSRRRGGQMKAVFG